MFVTFTLPSYGRVRPDGTPGGPGTLRLPAGRARRAALPEAGRPVLAEPAPRDGLPGAVLRGASRQQRRLAPHLHAAMRGAIPRAVLRQVAAATYHQVWWPPHERAVYVGRAAPGVATGAATSTPAPGCVLPTWDAGAGRARRRPGARRRRTCCGSARSSTCRGSSRTEGDADRRVAYLTKYLAKAISGHPTATGRRLTAAPASGTWTGCTRRSRWLPCSPRCCELAAVRGPAPGRAGGHDSRGVPRQGARPGPPRAAAAGGCWCPGSGPARRSKAHAADRAEVVRQVLEAAGDRGPGRPAAGRRRASRGRPAAVRVADLDPLDVVGAGLPPGDDPAIAERLRWRAEYEEAKALQQPATLHNRP